MKTQLTTLCLLAATILNAQNFIWAKSFGSTSDDKGFAITVDAFGNVYTVGSFQGTVDFDPGAGITSLTSNGSEDIFIQKLDASGNFLWAKSFGGSSTDNGHSIAADASGNIYITGEFRGTVDFDPGANTANLNSNGSQDIFVQKLDPFGNYLWAKAFGGLSFEEGYSITVDAFGNVYTTGYFRFRVDFDPGPGIALLSSASPIVSDIFIQKMDPSGNYLWAKSFGSASFDEGYSITVDGQGNVYTTGRFQGTVDFDPGSGVTNLTSNGSEDVFIQKLDASGNFLWAKAFGGNSSDYGYSIVSDAQGNVYTTGQFRGTVDFDPGAGTVNLSSNLLDDVFILKLDASGNYLWAKSFGGSSTDKGCSITLDALGDVYTTGSFAGIVDFDPGTGITNLSSSSQESLFVQKLDDLGNFLWAKTFGSASDAIGNSTAIDASGNIYTTGKFDSTTDFDPGVGVSFLTSLGNEDVFVQKMSQSSVGIKEKDLGSEIKIYPNPTDEFLISTSFKLGLSFTIYDNIGKVIKESIIKNEGEIDVTYLDKGTYFIKLKPKGNESQRATIFIKE